LIGLSSIFGKGSSINSHYIVVLFMSGRWNLFFDDASSAHCSSIQMDLIYVDGGLGVSQVEGWGA